MNNEIKVTSFTFLSMQKQQTKPHIYAALCKLDVYIFVDV